MKWSNNWDMENNDYVTQGNKASQMLPHQLRKQQASKAETKIIQLEDPTFTRQHERTKRNMCLSLLICLYEKYYQKILLKQHENYSIAKNSSKPCAFHQSKFSLCSSVISGPWALIFVGDHSANGDTSSVDVQALQWRPAWPLCSLNSPWLLAPLRERRNIFTYSFLAPTSQFLILHWVSVHGARL